MRRGFLYGMVLFFMGACIDLYEAEIERPDHYMVVEGLITDQPGKHLVRLTLSSTFGEPFPRIMVSGARVAVTDSSGNSTVLTEERAGHYYTPDAFAAAWGESYTLQIETSDGNSYASKEQKLMPPIQVEESSAERTIRPFYLSSSGSLFQQNVSGGKVFITLVGQDNPLFRFQSHLLADYFIIYPGVIPTMDYCWIKRSIDDYLDRDVGQGIGNGITGRHQIGFVPEIVQHLPILGFPNYVSGPENTFYGAVRIIMCRLFALNDDAYLFHLMRNKQLGSEGRFFDPIAAQLPGNVFNVNDTREPVLGLFEVSAITFVPVRVKITPFELSTELVNIKDTIPDNGCIYEEIPGFLREMY